MEDSGFNNLNTENLKDSAETWAGWFPALKKLTLYRGDPENSETKYVFVAIYDDQNEDERFSFLNWQSAGCMHIQEALPKFYLPNDPEKDYFLKWSWYPIPAGQPLALDGFVCKSPTLPLFPYNKSEHQEESGAAREGLTEREKTTLDLNFPPEIRTKYPPEVLALIQGARPEIDALWKGLTSIKKTLLEDNYDDIRKAYKDCACRYAKKMQKEFKYIREEILNDDSLYYFGDVEEDPKSHNPKRDFIGKLYQLLIHEHFPKELPEPKIPSAGYGAKILFERYKGK